MAMLPKLNTEGPDFGNALLQGMQIRSLRKREDLAERELTLKDREIQKEEDLRNALSGYKAGAGVDQPALSEAMRVDPKTGIALQTQERLLTHAEREDRIKRVEHGIKLFGAVDNQDEWIAALDLYGKMFGDDDLKGLPLKYSPELVNSLKKFGTTEKERLEIEKLKNEGWTDPKEGRDSMGNPIFFQVSKKDGSTRIVQDVAPKPEKETPISIDQLEASIWQKNAKDPSSLTQGEKAFLNERIQEKRKKETLSPAIQAKVDNLKEQAKAEISTIKEYAKHEKNLQGKPLITDQDLQRAQVRIKRINEEIDALIASDTGQTRNVLSAPAPTGKNALTGGGQGNTRPDSSPKGPGYFGTLKRPDGNVSTELSIGVNINGLETDIPTLVPTLTKDEVDYLLKGNKPTKEIVDKAVEHARQRYAQGKSPFAQEGEQQPVGGTTKATPGRQLAQIVKMHSDVTEAGQDPMANPKIKAATEAYFKTNPNAQQNFINAMNARGVGGKVNTGYKKATIGEAVKDVGKNALTAIKTVADVATRTAQAIAQDQPSQEKARQVIAMYTMDARNGKIVDFDQFVAGLKAAGIFVKENAKETYEYWKNQELPYLVKE